MIRCSTHFIATKATDFVRNKIDNFYSNGDALFREITERDYGIDGIIELFEDGYPSGKIALIQIKGTGKTIEPLKKACNYVSCKISDSNMQYGFQNNIPVILIYVSTKDNILYYECLNNIIDENLKGKLCKKQITIHIPVEKMIVDDMEQIFTTIKSFYDI